MEDLPPDFILPSRSHDHHRLRRRLEEKGRKKWEEEAEREASMVEREGPMVVQEEEE